jgi:hypothetical protein
LRGYQYPRRRYEKAWLLWLWRRQGYSCPETRPRAVH